MAQIARLKAAEISNGNLVIAEDLEVELDQLVNESNSQDTRITAVESNTFTSQKTFNSGLKTDTISEKTAAAGVTVDSVELKDGMIKLAGLPTVDGQIGVDSNLVKVRLSGTVKTVATTDAAASDTVAGFIEIAVQSEMEAGSSTTLAVTPGRQHFHPSAAKAWVNFNGTGTVAIRASYNITSITDLGTGDYQVNLTNSLSSANYAVVASGAANDPATDGTSGGTYQGPAPHTLALGSFKLLCGSNTGSANDWEIVCAAVFGDL